MLTFRGTSDIKFFVRRMFESMDDLAGKTVVDIPAGSGYISDVIRRCGGEVRAYDLFPEFFHAEGMRCEKANLQQQLPIESAHADIVLCQEGIEHLPNQLHALEELGRILKPNGLLFLTTPNISHIRAKFSNLLIEGDLYNRLPANEIDEVWYADGGDRYYGHIFLTGIQKLRTLANIAGFKLNRLHTVKLSTSSLVLGIPLYPLIWLANRLAYKRALRKNPAAGTDRSIRETYDEIRRLNLSPSVLFGKHLFVEFQKSASPRPRTIRKDPRTIT